MPSPVQLPAPTNKEGPYAWHTEAPTRKETYMAPPDLWPSGFPGGAKVAVFAVLTVT